MPDSDKKNSFVRFNRRVFFRRIKQNDRFVGTAHLLDFKTTVKMAVNPDAYEVLELLDRPLPIDGCAAVLGKRFGGNKKGLYQTVRDVIAPFMENGLAVYGDSPPRGRKSVIPPCLYLERDFNLNAVSIELLSTCNLKCRHCYGEFNPTRTEMLDKETVFSILDQLKELQCREVSFTGGEVLLYPGFTEILAYAHGYNFKVSFLTNGTLLTPRSVAELKKIGYMEIQVSLDGCRADIHDDFRGQTGAFEKSLRGIEMLKEAGFSLAVAHVLNRSNYETLGTMWEMINDMNVVFKAGPLLRYGNGSKNINRLYLDPGAYYKAFRSAARKVPPETAETPGNNGNGKDKTGYVERCAAGRGRMAIKANGDVLPCEILPSTPLFLMGNIHERSVKDIAFNYPRQNRLGDFNARNLPGCNTCSHVETCKGGCLAASYSEFGHIREPDPFSCARTKAVGMEAR